MRWSTLPWRLAAAGLLPLVSLSSFAHASASINVALETSFSAAPYLVELLETAALENSSSYFPLLDRIANGAFSDLQTEKELYSKFIDVLQQDGHLPNPESLSSFKFALALHAAAPRVEAHFQYYNTSVQPHLMAAQDAACPVWVYLAGQQYCSPALDRAQQPISLPDVDDELPFDRVLGANPEGPSSILYADITHPLFGEFHQIVSQTAREGRSTYRLRYRPSSLSGSRPLYVSGYGVELVLKRTDYIVIDDRDAQQIDAAEAADISLEQIQEDDLTDLKPLTSSEVVSLAANAASFIASSSDPFESLLQISSDFPRYSSVLASANASKEFLTEHRANREMFLPSGYNIFWINGVQIEPRQINAYSLLDHLRRERRIISDLQQIGLTASEAISLISSEVIAEAQANESPQRFDWRDDMEADQVLMWLNDLEQDKRYAAWPSSLRTLFQRMYPGQLPQVSRDIHNLIVPINITAIKDIELAATALQNLVKRTVPIRIALVPIGTGETADLYSKLSYHLLDTYGLNTLMAFFTEVASTKRLSTSPERSFTAVIKGHSPREGKEQISYEDVLKDEALISRLEARDSYVERLALIGPTLPFIVNGVILPRGDNWFEVMSSRVFSDLQLLQQAIYEGAVLDDAWVPGAFLFEAATRRNEIVFPSDPKNAHIADLNWLATEFAGELSAIPRAVGAEATLLSDRAHVLMVANVDSEDGRALLSRSLELQKQHPEIDLLILHNPSTNTYSGSAATALYSLTQDTGRDVTVEQLQRLLEDNISTDAGTGDGAEAATLYWTSKQELVKSLGLSAGQNGLWLNGRVIAPLDQSFTEADLQSLLEYERRERIAPVTTAITRLGLEERFTDALDLAKITSLVARSLKSDLPEGLRESAPLIRMDRYKVWNDTYTAIKVSNSGEPTIQIVAVIDPASELVQQWVPILKTLSQLNGVSVKIFLNPKDRLTELPVKRFFRQVISAEPTFDSDGSLERPTASFQRIPKDTLFNLGMVVPPSWLVAPKECIYDLDNIKLSNLPEGESVDALYELEHILIEGHARDVTTGPPPRGVELVLGTVQEPHFTDTIIMANLGYFQFKANPGFWHISLKPGKSSKIFNLDSVGASGYAARPGDETTSAALLSFQGVTLFPRLSRKPGMEDEDVLESSMLGGALEYLNKGRSFASSALSSLGFKKTSSTNAEINIFSVASGHLYERMLNIMMVSVMKHTKHTVKFWFIEQFLSPSFKATLPGLAQHYGFDFEMVTYKWPHWLRGQKEKQREIWGYKILFLDVLFPLDLDKVIFVDADQIVRVDMMDLNRVDLKGAPYGFTPMCDSRTEMEGFRFWKQGYWETYLRGKPYHISALYVVDLKRFRQLAAGDRLRQQYQALSSDPNSLSNLDQDLPNHMQHVLPIHSLSQEWLWCETWCSDESLSIAKTIDLCNNPLTKEPKLDRARRQVPEWTEYDEEIAAVLKEAAQTKDPSPELEDAAQVIISDERKRDEL
ncbi:killer toxin resistant protein [Elasticomyces elasticus]|uniref:Killer toxin resistant protein n=1 Tax=Exophiala sideris TaxID=1016849 RepID=A0ABR0J0B2_9EURO|nr:killer toxin resistant protein [Elasticomyces elasticus]KAK5023674.1 killer toxin resistant protein [Exophiala sideris]KAK5029674.1 killer toxin resistant protein [Exophiala sideris]KAK5053463.1 killer toxin resistant protein [Exophiala sideris]KAK5179221.1 killer toxin resistant protein [Eurotiomycetes sp. CCFEE 6388]